MAKIITLTLYPVSDAKFRIGTEKTILHNNIKTIVVMVLVENTFYTE